jgi:hypothetical protein
MKTKIASSILFAAALVSANATTIAGSGGTAGSQFVTSAGTFLTPTNAAVQVGSFIDNVFTQFAIADATPISFGTTVSLQGRWLGNFSDNQALTAAPFNGLQVWFKITTTADGGGEAYFGSTSNFPTNGGGVGDSLNVLGSTLTTFRDSVHPGTAAFAAGGGFTNGSVTVGVVPEPSAALLGALGALGLLRRRRI